VTRTLAVVGAINVDLVVSGVTLPGPGETVTGGAFARHHGGKGGNQAVAAARALGSPASGTVVVIGAVGRDELGIAAIGALTEAGVDTAVTVSDAPTGVALIVVNERGENQIAVAPGANSRLDVPDVERALREQAPELVLVSLEVPERAAVAVGAWCRTNGVPLVLNPAPAKPWARTMLGSATYVTPNQGELPQLGDIPAEVTVVETRGAGGARIHGDPSEDVPAPRVAVADTTGAGDCFSGVFAASLLEGLDLRGAVARAVTAAAISVTKPGARDGMPTRAKIDASLPS
jgi:ribokinase